MNGFPGESLTWHSGDFLQARVVRLVFNFFLTWVGRAGWYALFSWAIP